MAGLLAFVGLAAPFAAERDGTTVVVVFASLGMAAWIVWTLLNLSP